MDPGKRRSRRELLHEVTTPARPARRTVVGAASAALLICAFAGATARVERDPAGASALAVSARGDRLPDATRPRQDASREAVVRALVGALSDRDPAVRRSAMNALRDIGDPSGIEAVRPLLDDPEPELRRVAAEVLGLREPRANLSLPPAPRPEPLTSEGLARIRAALAAEDPGLRIDAANALGNALDPRTVPDLVPRLGDPEPGARQAVAYALGNIGDAGAVPGLLGAWPDPDAGVRRAIASALGAIGDPRAVPVLIEAIDDPDDHVRRQAAESLGNVRTGGVWPPAPAAPRAPPAACAPPRPGDDESRRSLAGAARVLRSDPDALRRESAAWAIGDLADREGADTRPPDTGAPPPKDYHHSLIAAVSDPAPSVRVAAICSLGRVGDARALEWLALRAEGRQDSAVRVVARWAIDRIRARSGSAIP